MVKENSDVIDRVCDAIRPAINTAIGNEIDADTNFGTEKAFYQPLNAHSWVIELVGECRQKLVIPEVFPVPLICVGNLVVGGAGKNSVALDIGTRLQAMGYVVVF